LKTVHDNFVRAAARVGSHASRIADEGGVCPLTAAPVYPADALNHNHGFLSLGLFARLPPAWSRQLPVTSPEERHGVTAVVEAVDALGRNRAVTEPHQISVLMGSS